MKRRGRVAVRANELESLLVRLAADDEESDVVVEEDNVLALSVL